MYSSWGRAGQRTPNSGTEYMAILQPRGHPVTTRGVEYRAPVSLATDAREDELAAIPEEWAHGFSDIGFHGPTRAATPLRLTPQTPFSRL